MGLGSLVDVSLKEARDKAADARKLKAKGIDPIEARRAERAAAALAGAREKTFDECRDAYSAAHRAGWRNAKRAAQWRTTLATYVTPIFGKLPVRDVDVALVMDVDVALVMKVLEPLWATKPEAASRLRGRIEAILDWAKVRGYRDGENPARRRGHLDHLLPKKTKCAR
jgi:hypothetical protein